MDVYMKQPKKILVKMLIESNRQIGILNKPTIYLPEMPLPLSINEKQ